MHAVIQKLMDAEKEAQGILDNGRLEAEQIAADAKMSAEQLITFAAEDTRREVRELLVKAQEEAEKEKQQRVSALEREIECRLQINPEIRARLIDAAIRSVCGLKQPNSGIAL